jgi:hypothetical protein
MMLPNLDFLPMGTDAQTLRRAAFRKDGTGYGLKGITGNPSIHAACQTKSAVWPFVYAEGI